MSQFFAEAEVLIRPNTAGFAAQLVEKVNAEILAAQSAIKPMVVGAIVTPATGAVSTGAATAGIAAQGAATERTAAATADLARAQALGAQAMEAEAAIAGAAALSTTELAAAKATLSAANKAVIVGERALGAALAAGNIALIDAASANLNLAKSEAAVAEGAALEAAATSRSAAAVAVHGKHVEQLGRGAGTAGLSFLGLRAQVLAASTAFIAGAAGALIARRAIGAASDRTEQLNKSVEVFTSSAKDVEAWAKTTATSMGISETAALAAASSYGGLFRTLGIGPEKAAALSESLVQLASDMASFNNVSVDRALKAIQSGLVGQVRPLRTLNVFLSAARVNQEALAETGKKTASALTDQEKILARYNLILKDSFIQAGDFQRTQGRLANQSRILSAEIGNLSATLGAALTPVLTEAVHSLNLGVTAVSDFIDNLKKLPKKVETTVNIKTTTNGQEQKGGGLIDIPGVKLARTIAGGLFFVVPIIQRYVDSQNQATKAMTAAQEASIEEARALRGMAPAFDAAAAAAIRMAAAVKQAQHQADVLTQRQEQIQAGVVPGGRPAEEDVLTKAIATQQAIIDKAVVGSKAYRDALRKKKQLMDELASLQAQDAADAQAAAQKIQTARDKADQAVQDAISRATGAADLRKTIAQGTAQTLDDLNAAIHERAVIRQLIRTLVPRIKDEQTRAAVLAQLRTAEAQANNEVKALQEERRKARVAARQTAIDARETHLQAMLSIAETTASSRDDLTALRALQAFYQRRIAELKRIKHRNQEQNAALDAYRVSLAQTNESIRNITKEAQKGNTFAQQAFAFLQMQQGFVSNLLGNLIPGGLTGGLVGGGAPTVPTNAAAARISGGFEQPRGVNFTAGEAARTRPPSGQQAERQIDWLRKIYAALVDLKRGSEHPEAKNQRASGAAAMDYARSGMGMGIG